MNTEVDEAVDDEAVNRVNQLVDELLKFGLTRVDAYRAAFVALALADGWSKARIGRYLGISRARIGQKVEKLRDYAMGNDSELSMVSSPILKQTLARADRSNPRHDHGGMIEFKIEDWQDLDFAQRLCLVPGKERYAS